MSNSDHQESAAARAWLCTPSSEQHSEHPNCACMGQAQRVCLPTPRSLDWETKFSSLRTECTGVGLVLPFSPGSHDSWCRLEAPKKTKTTGQTGIKHAGVRIIQLEKTSSFMLDFNLLTGPNLTKQHPRSPPKSLLLERFLPTFWPC